MRILGDNSPRYASKRFQRIREIHNLVSEPASSNIEGLLEIYAASDDLTVTDHSGYLHNVLISCYNDFKETCKRRKMCLGCF